MFCVYEWSVFWQRWGGVIDERKSLIGEREFDRREREFNEREREFARGLIKE